MQGIGRISPGDLLKLLVRQLSEGGTPLGSNLPGCGLADRAFLTLWPDPLLARNPIAKQFVAVRPNRFPVWQTVIQGSGSPLALGYDGQNTMTGHNAVVSLVCFTQINADPEMKSTQALTEQALGTLSFVQRVATAVQFWNPADLTGGTAYAAAPKYLREPARMTDGGFGVDTMEVGGAWWVKTPLDLELKFTAKYPQAPT